MKKIFSLILVAIMCVFNTVVVSAESNIASFSTISNVGIINISSQTGINTFIEPELDTTDSIVIKTNNEAVDINSVKLVIEGIRYNRTYITNTEYDFINYTDANCTVTGKGDYWKLGICYYTAPINQFLIDSYTNIQYVGIKVSGTITTDSYSIYSRWGNETKYLNTDAIFTIIKDFNNRTNITDLIRDLIPTLNSYEFVSKEVRNDYSFLPTTDFNRDNIITRNEVVKMSYSEFGEGKGIPGLEGLASQVASFFNKQTNGKITFRATEMPAVITSTWSSGVPITSSRFFSPVLNSNNITMGLFFNYDKTGTLVSSAIMDANGEITFDISEILNDIDGNSLALINNLYYGLIGGLIYNDTNATGLKIDSIVLSYETENDVTESTEVDEVIDDDITTDDDDDAAETEDTIIDVETIEDTTQDDTDEDEDTVATIIEDTDEEVVNEATIEEDENPNTGVAVSLIPSIIAASACIIFKKRK